MTPGPTCLDPQTSCSWNICVRSLRSQLFAWASVNLLVLSLKRSISGLCWMAPPCQSPVSVIPPLIVVHWAFSRRFRLLIWAGVGAPRWGEGKWVYGAKRWWKKINSPSQNNQRKTVQNNGQTILAGHDDSHFELITPRHYIKGLRFQGGSLEGHLLEISTEQPDMIAKKAAWGEAGWDHFSEEENGQEALSLWLSYVSPSSSALKPRVLI